MNMNPVEQNPDLTSALEDYLETIYELVRENKLARVRDIAKARGVRAASVSPAMRRLSELDLIRYHQREYIDLTPEGERLARRVFARHQVLRRFFAEILRVPADQALADACAMEHNLSPQGMSQLVSFFEFLSSCPEGKHFLERFHRCPRLNRHDESCAAACGCEAATSGECSRQKEPTLPLSKLLPGQQARIIQVTGQGAIRQRLLDMGLLPEVSLRMERVAPAGDPLWIKVQGFQLSLRRKEAESVLVSQTL